MYDLKNSNNLISRRGLLKLLGGGLLGGAAALVGIQPWSKQVYSYGNRQFHMGTFVDIKGWDENKEKIRQAIEESYLEITHVDNSMSYHKERSMVNKINTSSKDRLTLPEDLAYVLDKAHQLSKITEGAFDVTVAPLLGLWGFYDRKLNQPDQDDLKETLKRVGYENYKVNYENKNLILNREDMKFDLGGIAKGYAVDRAVEKLKEYDLTGGLVNAGGDIRVFGSPGNTKPWQIGLQNPKEEGKILCSINLSNGSLTTSGNYESFFTYHGEKLGHIINPKTGVPVQGVLSVSILTDTALEADALSTGAFSQGPKKTISFVEQLNNTDVIIISRENGELNVNISSELEGQIKTSRIERSLKA